LRGKGFGERGGEGKGVCSWLEVPEVGGSRRALREQPDSRRALFECSAVEVDLIVRETARKNARQ